MSEKITTLESQLYSWSGEININRKKIGVLSDGYGNLSFGMKVKYPPIYQRLSEDYKENHKQLVQLLESLGLGVSFRQYDFYFTNEYELEPVDIQFSTSENRRAFNGRGLMRHECFWLFSITTTPNIQEQFSVMMGKSNNVSKSKGVSKKQYDQYLNKAQSTIRSILNGLSALSDKKFKICNEALLKGLVCGFNNMEFKNGIQSYSNEPINSVIDAQPYLLVGNKRVGVTTLFEHTSDIPVTTSKKVLPDSAIYETGVTRPTKTGLPCSYMYPVGLGLPIDHVVVSTIHLSDYEALQGRIKSEFGKEAMLKIWHRAAVADKGLLAKGDELSNTRSFIELLKQERQKGCTFLQNVFVSASTEDQLAQNIEHVQKAYKTIDASAHVENVLSAHFYFSSSPGLQNYAHISTQVMSLNDAAKYLPGESTTKSDPHGIMCVDRFGKLVIVDPEKPMGIKLNNHNELIFGGSGSGKSVFINDRKTQYYDLGQVIFILDVGGSYKRSVKQFPDHQVGYYDSSDRKNVKLNPFLLAAKDKSGQYQYQNAEDDDKEDKKEGVYIVNAIYAVIEKIIKFGGDIDGRLIIKKSIEAYYDWVNEQNAKNTDQLIPKLKGYYQFLEKYAANLPKEEQDKGQFFSVRLRLREFAIGEYGWLLNADENLTVSDKRIIVFDLKDANENEDIKSVFQTLVTQFVTQMMSDLPIAIRKRFIIDEAVDFLTGDVGVFIAGLFRKIRKEGGAISIATQSVEFLDSADKLTRSSMLRNSDIKVLLGMKDAKDRESAQEFLSLTEQDMKYVDDLQGREYFIKYLDQRFIFNNLQSRQALLTYTTDKDEREPVDAAIKKHRGDLRSGIEEYIEQNEN